MGKKYTIYAVAAVALLLAGIAISLWKLYGDVPAGDKRQKVSVSWDVLRAVPSDASAVLVLDGSRHARNVVADSTGIISAVVAQGNPELMEYLSAVSGNRMAVSLHNSGALVPLVVTSTAKLDSAKLASYIKEAKKAGLNTAVSENFLLASRSMTFVNSSVRHLEEGASVLGSIGPLADKVSGSAVFFVCHSSAPRLMQQYFSPELRREVSAVRALTPWSAYVLEEMDSRNIVLEGVALPAEDSGSYFSRHSGQPVGQAQFPEVLPFFAEYAYSVPVGEIKSGKSGSAQEWLRAFLPRELARTAFRMDDGVLREVLLLRGDKSSKPSAPSANPHPGFLAEVMGERFALPDSVCASIGGGWTVFGDATSVEVYADKGFLDYSLKSRLEDSSVEVPQGYVAYLSLTDAPQRVKGIFAPGIADALASFAKGAGFAPAFVSLDLHEEYPAISVRAEKHPLKGNKVVLVAQRDTTVVVPSGPFPVTNCSTGKTNMFYQNSALALCLNDENGKGLWGIPFGKPLCGRVKNIDYLRNGKIQFLFASGSKLYILDRLGRWVGNFSQPSLGKEILLGPDLYDFPEDGGYTVMVLHKDNTLERYRMDGRKPAGWKGISAPETVKDLPELVREGNNRYWVVKTSARTIVYPFEGGEPKNIKLKP